MHRGPEEQKLLDYINENGIVGANVWWTPAAAGLSREERAAKINGLLASVASGRSEPLDFGDASEHCDWSRPPMTLEEFLSK